MRFTAAEVFRGVQRIAPFLTNNPSDRVLIAENFNDALAELVFDVVAVDEERLASEHRLPRWVVKHDPINLGWYEAVEPADIADALVREWLHIAYIDWESAGEGTGEVAIATLEARNRAANEYRGFPTAFLHGHLRLLEKLAGWGGVESLIVYGVLAPEPVTATTLGTAVFDYPRSLEVALRWDLLARLVPADAMRQDWMGRRSETRVRLLDDARAHIASRIDDLPLTY